MAFPRLPNFTHAVQWVMWRRRCRHTSGTLSPSSVLDSSLCPGLHIYAYILTLFVALPQKLSVEVEGDGSILCHSSLPQGASAAAVYQFCILVLCTGREEEEKNDKITSPLFLGRRREHQKACLHVHPPSVFPSLYILLLCFARCFVGTLPAPVLSLLCSPSYHSPVLFFCPKLSTTIFLETSVYTHLQMGREGWEKIHARLLDTHYRPALLLPCMTFLLFMPLHFSTLWLHPICKIFVVATFSLSMEDYYIWLLSQFSPICYTYSYSLPWRFMPRAENAGACLSAYLPSLSVPQQIHFLCFCRLGEEASRSRISLYHAHPQAFSCVAFYTTTTPATGCLLLYMECSAF